MGVSGSGKTTVASKLAEHLGWNFAEADSFHSPANVEKMRSGVPLTDADRWPWLEAIAARIGTARRDRKPLVVTCSALKRSYRDRLRSGHDDVRFVYLQGSYDTVVGRMAGRTGHYMPPSLLQSQFDALEEPTSDEAPITVPVDGTPEEIVTRVVDALGLSAPHPQRRSG